jgi:hypothetical protein
MIRSILFFCLLSVKTAIAAGSQAVAIDPLNGSVVNSSNLFNGSDQLLKLNQFGQYPPLDASLLVGNTSSTVIAGNDPRVSGINRQEIYIECRADSNGGTGPLGSGTATDPYDGTTASRFDALLGASGSLPTNSTIHLGKGIFPTITWMRPKAGDKIYGEGMGITKIQLSALTGGGTQTHIIHSNDTTDDGVELHDLTADGNFSGLSSQIVKPVTVSSSSPAIFTATGSNLVSGRQVIIAGCANNNLNSISNTYGVWYVLAAGLTANTFEVAATSGGSAINNTSAADSGTYDAAMYTIDGIELEGNNLLEDNIEVTGIYGVNSSNPGSGEAFANTLGGYAGAYVSNCQMRNVFVHNYYKTISHSINDTFYADGSSIFGCNGALIENCSDDGGLHSFGFGEVNGGTVRHCTTTANSQIAFYTDSSPNLLTNISFLNNTFIVTPPTTNASSVIQIGNGTNGNGPYVFDGNYLYINNFSTASEASGILFYSGQGTGSDVKITNNTFGAAYLPRAGLLANQNLYTGIVLIGNSCNSLCPTTYAPDVDGLFNTGVYIGPNYVGSSPVLSYLSRGDASNNPRVYDATNAGWWSVTSPGGILTLNNFTTTP